MRVSHLYISFIIEYEYKEIVESGEHLPKIGKIKPKWTTFYGRTKMVKLDNIYERRD